MFVGHNCLRGWSCFQSMPLSKNVYATLGDLAGSRTSKGKTGGYKMIQARPRRKNGGKKGELALIRKTLKQYVLPKVLSWLKLTDYTKIGLILLPWRNDYKIRILKARTRALSQSVVQDGQEVAVPGSLKGPLKHAHTGISISKAFVKDGWRDHVFFCLSCI